MPRERGGDVEKENVLDLALEHAALDAGADGDDLVGVDALMGGLADEGACGLDDAGHAGHAADEDEFIDLVCGEPCILEAGLGGGDGALEEAVAKLFHLGAGQARLDVLGAGGVGRDEGEVDVVLLGGTEGDLGLLRLLLDALEGVGLPPEIHAAVPSELVEDPVHDGVVPVVAAEMGVAVGGLHLEDAVANFEDGDVEGAAAEVIDGDFLVLLLVEAVGEGGGGGLVDDAEDFEPGDPAGILGGLALGVVEVGGDGDDGLGDGLAETDLGVGLELGEDHGGDLGGG